MDISQNSKQKLHKTSTFSEMLYEVETWTLKTVDRKRIDAFEKLNYR